MRRLLCVLALLGCFATSSYGLDIQAQGLFKNTAVLKINGQQRMLKVGKRSPEGVLLVSSTPKKAVIEIDGKQQEITLSRTISTSYAKAAPKKEVSIQRNQFDQYITMAAINGKSRRVLVDTGANIIAMSSNDARLLGLDYEKGQPSMVTTASGRAPSYRLELRTVKVGDITVSGVEASIIEGEYPEMILLGMSFLKRVNMREENGVLYLQGKY